MDRHRSLKGIVLPNVADLADGRFDQTQTIALQGACPILDRILNEAGGRAQPVQLGIESIRGVVRDVVVEKGTGGREGGGVSVARSSLCARSHTHVSARSDLRAGSTSMIADRDINKRGAREAALRFCWCGAAPAALFLPRR